MEGIKNILAPKKERNKNIHSEAHFLADEISTAFGERKMFAMYLGVIKRIGAARARQLFGEIKEGNAREPGKLFIWKSKELPRATEIKK